MLVCCSGSALAYSAGRRVIRTICSESKRRRSDRGVAHDRDRGGGSAQVHSGHAETADGGVPPPGRPRTRDGARGMCGVGSVRSGGERIAAEGGYWRIVRSGSHCGAMGNIFRLHSRSAGAALLVVAIFVVCWFVSGHRLATAPPVKQQALAKRDSVSAGAAHGSSVSTARTPLRQRALAKRDSVSAGAAHASSVSTAKAVDQSRPSRSGGPVHADAPVIAAGRLLEAFSGVGNRSIGSLSERAAVVLQWSTAGWPLQLFTERGFLLVDSQPGYGRIRLARGDYRGLRVGTQGAWTIQLRAAR